MFGSLAMVSRCEHDDVETIAQYRGSETPTPLSLPDHCSGLRLQLQRL
jgi:hypothetical protein